MRAIVEFAEDHLAAGGLQNAGHGNVDGFRDHLLGIIDHHHGPVVKVGDTLIEFFSLFEDEHPHDLAWQHDGLHGIGELVDVEHHHAVQLRHLVKVEIVSDDLTVVNLGQLDQFHIHFAYGRKIVFHDLNIEVGHLLNPLQHVQPAPPAIALHGIGRIGHHLQFVQHELRNHQHAVEETRVGDIGDTSVDNHAGIQDLEGFLGPLLTAKYSAEGREVQHFAFARADDQADVGHPQQQADLEEVNGGG